MAQEQQGGIGELINTVGQGLTDLADALGGDKALGPVIAQILGEFTEFAGQLKGGPAEPQKSQQGSPMPMEAGPGSMPM